MVGAQPRTSCTSLFKQSEILLVLFHYLLSWMSFIIINQEIFQTNLSLHNINTRNEHHLHRPDAKLSCFQRSTFFAGITNFQSLTPIMTTLKNDKAKFKAARRKYPHTHFFYTVDDLSRAKMICNIFILCL
jgi:predicted tellurium resistance membrane protein TerC